MLFFLVRREITLEKGSDKLKEVSFPLTLPEKVNQMTSKKFCDKCDSLADTSDLKCSVCDGTSFNWKKSDLAEEQTPIENLSTWKLRGISSSYDPGILEGLLDTSFDKFITKKIVRFAYIVSLISATALAIFSFLGLWRVTGFTQSESAVPFLIFVLGFSLVAVLLVLWLALTRLKLESFIALVNISKNTEK